MSVIDPIITQLRTITGLTNKVYHAEALKNAEAPFVFWLQTAESIEQALDGYTSLESAGFEVHVVAKKLASLDTMSAAVRAAIIAFQGTTSGGYIYERVNIRMASPEIHEKEVSLYRKVFRFDIDYQTVPAEGTNTTTQNEED